MPRSQAQATLTTMAHEIFTSDTTRSLLEAAEAEVTDLDFDSDEASTVRVVRRNFDQESSCYRLRNA